MATWKPITIKDIEEYRRKRRGVTPPIVPPVQSTSPYMEIPREPQPPMVSDRVTPMSMGVEQEQRARLSIQEYQHNAFLNQVKDLLYSERGVPETQWNTLSDKEQKSILGVGLDTRYAGVHPPPSGEEARLQAYYPVEFATTEWGTPRLGTINQPIIDIGGIQLSAPDIAGIAILGKISADVVTKGLPIAYQALMRTSVSRNLNNWAKTSGIQIPKDTKNFFVDEFVNYMSKRNPGWLTKESIKTLFRPSAGKIIPTMQAQQAADKTTSEVVQRIAPALSKFTAGGSAVPGQAKSMAEIIQSLEGIFPPSAQAVQGGMAELTPEVPPKPEITPVTPEVTEPLTETIGNFNKGAMVQFKPDGIMYEVVSKSKTRVTLKDGEGNQSSIPISQQVYPLEPTAIPKAVTPEIITPKILPKDKIPASLVSNKERYDFTEQYFIQQGIEQNRLAPIEEQAKNVRLSKPDKAARGAFIDGERIIRKGSLMDWKAEEQGNKILGDLWAKYELKPEVAIPQAKPTVTAPEAKITPVGLEAESVAVTEVTGVPPPKPPKDWDKVGGQLYDRFKKQASQPTPNTVPLSDSLLRLQPKIEKVTNDEFARLNWLGWQAELDVAMIRASGSQSAELYRETMKSITNSLGKDSNLLSYVDDYLMLRRQLEVLKATGRKYFVIKKGEVSQRFTAKQIGLLFDQMKKELGVENYAKVKEAASHIPALYNEILKGTQELTPGQIEGLIKKYPWFTPTLFRDDTVPINITQKLSPRQIRELTTLESDKEQISPLLSLPTTIAKRIRAQAINDARKSISELAVDPKNSRLIGGDVEIVDKMPEGAFIDFYSNGERKYLKLGKGSEWIAQDIELFTRQPPGMMISMVRSLQNLSKMFFTTYNPGFVAWNTAFDGMVAYFAEGITPWGFGKALAGNIKAMFVDVPSVNQFRLAGGELFGFFEKGSSEGLGFGEKEKVITPYLARKKGQLVLRNPESLKRFINPFTLIRELGIAGENAARRATYEKAIKEGLSDKEATLRARRVTVDFSRFSTASRFINDWYIYFNPAMQGLLLPGRAITKNPRSLWRLAVLVSAYAGLTFYNQSYDEYADVRDSDKVGKLLVMLPSNEFNKYGQKVPHYLTLMPFREFALFTAPIEYLMGRLRTEEPEAYRTIGQEFGSLYPVVSPLSMISESGGFVMPTQIISTIQQIIQNHDDFRNRPIVDDEMALLPASQQYDQYTNTLAIRIGQALNMSPKKLDFFVSNMFGALGNDTLRAIDLAIQNLDKEDVDERIAGLVNELRALPTRVPPNRIEVARETFLEELSVEDRELVLNMERLPDDKFPFIQSLIRRFFRDYGGQVYQTAKEKALANRTLDDYPPEALAELQKTSTENANNLIANKISKYQYDQNRSRYRAYFSGGSTAEWREAMIEGGVARSDIDKYMPEAYKRSEEFQAVSAYMEIQQKYIDKSGGVLDSDAWGMIEAMTIAELRYYYSDEVIKYAIAHKDDWIDKLPEPARSVERQRAVAIENETWWDNYRDIVKGTEAKTSTTKPSQIMIDENGKLILK